MGSAHIEDDDWFDDTEEDVDNRIEREDDDLIIVKTDNSPKLKSQEPYFNIASFFNTKNLQPHI